MGRVCGILILGAGMVVLAGCGQRIEAPEERPWNRPLPAADAYSFRYERIGFDTTSDLELARGGLLYVASTDGITPYYQTVEGGPGWTFGGVLDPAAVCEAPNGQIIVADQGDTTVKVFDPDGGDPVASFQDADWIQFGGIAADGAGNIFVADRQRSFVRSYLADGTPRFAEDMADSGFGLGHVLQPNGLFYDGEHLWIADTGKNWVQKVVPDSVQLGLAFLDGYTYEDVDGNEIKIPFSSPIDVATDTDGYLYVADQGNKQIFKFDADLVSFAEVNYDSLVGQPPHLRAIGVSETRVYAIDDSLGSILVWEL
jgi:DNA-binding beta-propeller fold protein YncE